MSDDFGTTFTRESEKLGDLGLLERLTWWLAFHPLITIIVGLVVYGLPAWLISVFVTNRNHDDILEDYQDYVAQQTERLTGQKEENTSSYTLTSNEGGYPLLKPAERYFSRNLLVGDTSVTVYEGVGLDMSSRVPYLSDQSTEVYYDQVSSVTYEDGELRIKTSDGDSLRYASTRSPDDALSDLQSRVREYKEN